VEFSAQNFCTLSAVPTGMLALGPADEQLLGRACLKTGCNQLEEAACTRSVCRQLPREQYSRGMDALKQCQWRLSVVGNSWLTKQQQAHHRSTPRAAFRCATACGHGRARRLMSGAAPVASDWLPASSATMRARTPSRRQLHAAKLPQSLSWLASVRVQGRY
jgi:hypothetical protein